MSRPLPPPLLSPSLSVFTFLSVCLSISLSLSVVCLSVCPFVTFRRCLSLSVSLCPPPPPPPFSLCCCSISLRVSLFLCFILPVSLTGVGGGDGGGGGGGWVGGGWGRRNPDRYEHRWHELFVKRRNEYKVSLISCLRFSSWLVCKFSSCLADRLGHLVARRPPGERDSLVGLVVKASASREEIRGSILWVFFRVASYQ